MAKEQVTISILFKIKIPNNRTVKSSVETNKKIGKACEKYIMIA